MSDDSAATGLPSPGTYRLEPEASRIRCAGRHLFGAARVRASFAAIRGELRLAAPMAGSRSSVTVDAASFTSGNARRDRDVRGRRLLDVATYPDITFECDRWRRDEGRWVARGTVTAHGTTVPVDLTVDRVVPEEAGFRVHGRAEHVDRSAFGITGVRGLAGRYLDLEVDAAFVVA